MNRNLLIALFFLVGLPLCKPKKNNSEALPETSNVQSHALPSVTPTTSKYLNPLAASVSVKKEVQQAPSVLFEGITVPTLSLTLQQADYVQILRCADSFEFKTQDGRLVENILHKASNQSALKWAWTSAWNQRNSCEIVSEKSPVLTYPDIAAPTGRFYYILNPCILKTHSIENKDTCSYLVEVTHPFSFTNVLKEEIRKKAIELSNAESSLRALMAQIPILANSLSLAIVNCENFVAQHNTMESLRNGFAQLAIFVGVVVVGFALSGGIMVLMYGVMAGMIGEMFMMQFKAFAISGNHCMSPTKTGDDYGIHDLYNQLQTIFSTSIPTTQKQMENLMDQMNKYDNRVMTYNQGIEKLKTFGVDITNTQSVKNAVSTSAQTKILPGDATATPNTTGSDISP